MAIREVIFLKLEQFMKDEQPILYFKRGEWIG